ncbi:TonB-dependent receptor [candidate division KSB1 bacterium]|nr:TonB-dependent receptor [candidate division KSB1 bacterium]
MRTIPVLFIFLLMTQIGFAGVTGKIAGKITDRTTGEPLIGANVVIDGTERGAAADESGNFMILRIPPGKYTLRITMIGYKRARVTDVKVFSDRTTKMDYALETEAVQGEEVIVVAGREPVEFDRTNTASYVSEEEIANLPVSNLAEVIQMQTGVVTDAGGAMHFRGGRSREVAYMIDGMPVTNAFSQGGGSNVAIENNFIKELQVISGTFNAEYGQAQSGVVNVVTKVPERNFSGTLEVLTGGYYAPNKPMYIGLDNYQPLDEKEAKFSFSGPISFWPNRLGKLGFFVNGRIVDSKGYLKGERRYMPEDGWEIEVYREWYRAIYDPEDTFVIPIPDSLHTGDGKIVDMNWHKFYNFNAKLVYQPITPLTISYNVFHSSSQSKSYSNSWRFCPDGTGQGKGNATTHLLTLTHVLRENIFYNLRFSHQQNASKSFAFEDASDPRYQITATNAWDPGKITGYDYGGISSWDRSWFNQWINILNGDLTWQLNSIIELKAGFDAKIYSLNYKNAPMREVFGYEEMQFPFSRKEIEEFYFPYEFFRDTTANFKNSHIYLRETSPDSTRDEQFYVSYNRYPREAAGFLQTKLEMGEIILNAGLRVDLFWPRDRWCPDYTKVYPEIVGAPQYYQRAKMKYQFSPRFGLSFPISEKGALRLSYGHFFQTPSYEKMYQNPVLPHYNQYSIEKSRIGNPNLKPEKTIQYELGLQQQLSSDFSMELTVFYKDIRDLLGIEILTLSNAATFYRYINKEYGESGGVTLAFDYGIMNRMLTAGIDYTYMLAKGSASNPEILRDITVYSGSSRGSYNLAIRRINFLDWDQTHTLNASVNIRPVPSMNISFIGQIGSGLPYSPATLDPSIELPGDEWDNAGRKPIRWDFDMLLSQKFRFVGFEWNAILKVFNVFNHLNENRVKSITGRAGPDAYLPELAYKRYRRLELIGDFTRDEADYNPTDYSRPRFIQLGLELGF